jgi:hypothetical protein
MIRPSGTVYFYLTACKVNKYSTTMFRVYSDSQAVMLPETTSDHSSSSGFRRLTKKTRRSQPGREKEIKFRRPSSMPTDLGPVGKDSASAAANSSDRDPKSQFSVRVGKTDSKPQQQRKCRACKRERSKRSAWN